MDRRSMLCAGFSALTAATAGCGAIGDHVVGRMPTTPPETDRQVNRREIYQALGYPAGTGTLEEIGGVALAVGLCCDSERVDLGRSEAAAGADNYIADACGTTLPDEAGIGEQGIESGETATVRLVTPSGGITEDRLVGPETRSCRAPIQL